ncbi:MAG: uroporphyrinogen decarboxylase family protein [bacterium]
MKYSRNRSGGVFFQPIVMQFAARQIGVSYRDLYLDHRVLVEANLHCLEKFGMDAVSLISDPSREAEAFGATFDYPESYVPRCTRYPVKTIADIKALKNPDVYQARRTRDRIDGAALFQQQLDDSIPVIGWIEGPLAEACDLAGFSEMMLKLALEPDFCKRLLAKVVQTAKDFAGAQIEAGCQIIGIGDAACSQISPAMYKEFVQPYHREMIDAIHTAGALAKLHICGNITHLLPEIKKVGADIVDLDWMVDLDLAFEQLGDGIIRSGNLDPVAVIERLSATEIGERTKTILEKEKHRPFWLSGGCEITIGTPVENMRIMRDVVI